MLDNFNRSDATLGANWTSEGTVGTTGTVAQSTGLSTSVWSPTFSNGQLAGFTLANSASLNGSAVVLKARGTGTAGSATPFDAAIRVRAISSRVVVATTTNRGQSYTNRASFPATFAIGDKLIATAANDGTVNVYKVSGSASRHSSVRWS